jgi:hypothetical protein
MLTILLSSKEKIRLLIPKYTREIFRQSSHHFFKSNLLKDKAIIGADIIQELTFKHYRNILLYIIGTDSVIIKSIQQN